MIKVGPVQLLSLPMLVHTTVRVYAISNFFLLLPKDHNCGYCSLLPNLLKGFGWNPGKRMLRWFGEQLKERTGDGDITFKEVSQHVNSPDLPPNISHSTSWENLMTVTRIRFD